MDLLSRHNLNYATNWSAPQAVITSTKFERANCDPSVVYFDAGDGPYYYMLFSGNVMNVQTVNFVARSKSPEGPFYKYTNRGTWEIQPANSKVLQSPVVPAAENSNIYGAGQPSLVVHNGLVYQWFTDTTAGGETIFLTTSRDLVNWSNPVRTNASNVSIDVKFDDETAQFYMFEIVNIHMPDAFLAYKISVDGIQWSESKAICDQKCFPSWSHNIGVAGDLNGHLVKNNDEIFVAFGAPANLSPRFNNDCKLGGSGNCWGNWDLYGFSTEINTLSTASPSLTLILKNKTGSEQTEIHRLKAKSGYQKFDLHLATALHMTNQNWTFSASDMDRDQKNDVVGIVKTNTGSGYVEIHSLSSALSFQNFNLHTATAIPSNGIENTDLFLAEWDNDGIPDLFQIIKQNTGSGKTEVHILSGRSNYQNYIGHFPTSLGLADTDHRFLIQDHDKDGVLDLVVLKGGSSTAGLMEMHVLSGASQFQNFIFQLRTKIPVLSSDRAQYEVLDYDADGQSDLIMILKNQTGSHRVEIHVMSGANRGEGQYQTYIANIATGLHTVGDDAEFTFGKIN